MKQTILDLNGPVLSFQTQPIGVTATNAGIATFVGICSAYFIEQTPTNTFASNTGSVAHRWYAVGVGALSDGSFRGATLSGTATTTLTVSNATNSTISGTQFYLEADYTPSAYQSSSPVTAGTARSTGNAINEVLNSNIVTLTVLPTIAITSQPTTATIGTGSRVNFSVSATISDSNFGDLSYQWNIDGQNLTDNGNTIIGANQPTLFFVPTSVGVSTVKVTVSNPSAVSVESSIVNLNVLSPRNIIVFEGFDAENNYKRKEINLGVVDNFTLTDETFGTNFNIISFYAPENSIDADLEIRASKGSDVGSYSGGQGGFSRIRITLEKDVEYVVLGISNNSGLFIYRKSNLIAVVGKGGNAGSSGNGGAGGGVNLPGESGSGRNSGIGGAKLSTGQLTTNGIFGSNSTITTFQSKDSKASIPDGGRTISCSKGNYWLSRGKSPCEDVGLTQFYNTNGTLISQSSLINRGFKAGYSITATEGSSISTGGNGGNGATGGSGGNLGGGGGGSGYTDGSYTITSTSSGGNTSSNSTINFKVFIPLPPISGCTDPSANNYNPNAAINDGSCRYSPVSSVTPTSVTPTPTPVTASSIYGTGLQGTIEFNNGSQGPAINGSNAFITNLKPEFSTYELNAVGSSNIATANFIATVYQQVLGRPPDGPGFDFWFGGAVSGSYTDLAHLERAIIAAAPPDSQNTRINGGINGTFDTTGNRII